MSMTTPDRIEKQIVLKAPIARVWKAISNAAEFGRWFGVKFEGAFSAGQAIVGAIQPTAVDLDVAKTQKKFEGFKFTIHIEAIQTETLFSFRWHPYAVDSSIDYSKEQSTLIEYRLEKVPEGTRVKLSESGFHAIPASRRDEAYRMDNQGWEAQMKNLEKYVALSD